MEVLLILALAAFVITLTAVALKRLIDWYSPASRLARLASGVGDKSLPPPVFQLNHSVDEHSVIHDSKLVHKLKGKVEFVGYIPRADTITRGSNEYDIEEIYVVDTTGRIHTITRRRNEVGGFNKSEAENEARWLAKQLGVSLEGLDQPDPPEGNPHY